MRIELNQKQTQKQILSQRMIQSVEILQMSALELSDYIKEAALENPMMELAHHETEMEVKEQLKKLEWLSRSDEQNKAYYSYDQEEQERDRMDLLGKRESETLSEALHLQLIGKGYTDREMEIFDYLIHCLDSKGYMTVANEELAQGLGIREEDVRQYLSVLKGLEPAGVCASSLKECLLIQLKQKGYEESTEWEIVDSYMELLGKNQLHNIAKQLKITVEQVKEAVEFIKTLNPRPAQGYDNGEMMRYIVPDITVVMAQEGFEILLNQTAYPDFHVSREYLAMLQDVTEDEVKEYLLQKMRHAKQLSDCVSRRHATLMELAEYIVESQKDFFLYGEKNLKPTRILDAAEGLGIHESTVSRAVKDKYLQCCWGIYPLSYFFSREFVSGEGESNLSSESVKEQLRQVIEAEDKKKPLSDQKLSDAMAKLGITISRRTVTKYREAMGIPNGRERKEF